MTAEERQGYQEYKTRWLESIDDRGNDPLVLANGDELEIASIPPGKGKSGRRAISGPALALVVRSPRSQQEARYVLPASPEGRERLGTIVGEVATDVIALRLVDVGQSDLSSLVLYDAAHRRIACSLTPWPGGWPARGARDGDLWVSVDATDDRPDPNLSPPLPRMGLSKEPVDQRLYRLDESLTPVPTEHAIPCRRGQLLADARRGLLYSTTWHSQTVQERDADGMLLRSWAAPGQLKQINALAEGFGDFEIVARGCKHGMDLFTHVDLVYGLDTDTGRWVLLDQGSTLTALIL